MKLTAEELNVSLALVDDLTSFYWSRIHKAISGLEGPEIQAASLGTFRLKYWKIEDSLVKHNKFLRIINTNSFAKYEIFKHHEERIRLLTDLKEYFEKEQIRKKQIKQSSNVESDKDSLEK